MEETGIRCEVTGIVGIYTDPKHIILYTSNGEARQEFSIMLTATPLNGEPTPSSESTEVRWVPESELPGYTMDRSMRIRSQRFPLAQRLTGDHLGPQARGQGRPSHPGQSRTRRHMHQLSDGWKPQR